MSARINDLQAFYKSVKAERVELVGNTNLIWLSPDVIEEEEGFNLRDYDRPDTVAHIQKLAEAWIKGDQMPPLEVRVRAGRCFVRDGHCRLRGARLAISRGAAIRRVSVIELQGNDATASVRLLTSNDSLKLTILQRGRGYVRLRNLGWSDTEISTDVGVTENTIRHAMNLLSLPDELQGYIESDMVSHHLAASMFRDHGIDCIEMFQDEYKKQLEAQEAFALKASGKKKNGSLPAPEASPETDKETSTEVAPIEAKAEVVKVPQIRLQGKHFAKRTRALSKPFARGIGDAVTELRAHMAKAAPSEADSLVEVKIPIELFDKLMELSSAVYKAKDAAPLTAETEECEAQLKLEA
jgi:hypothetical protein